MDTVRLIISGKVQGVFYRASAKKKADELKITGWIQNTRDGNVEAMITGEPDEVNLFIEWCKTGPDRAAVSEVQIQKEMLQKFDSFLIER
jgi:acylphosphatase